VSIAKLRKRRAALVASLEAIDAKIAEAEAAARAAKARREQKALAKAERARARAADAARRRGNERRRALRIKHAAEADEARAERLRRRADARARIKAKREVDALKVDAFESGLERVSRSASRHYGRKIVGPAVVGKGQTTPVFDARRALIWLCFERFDLTARDIADCSGIKAATVTALRHRPLSMDALSIVRGVLLDLAPSAHDSVADGQR